MKNKIKFNIAEAELLNTGTFNNGDIYKIYELESIHIPTIMAFQDLISDNLKDEEKSFYFKKSKGFLKEHFNSGSKAIGIVSGDLLFGQALIVHPTQATPKTGMTDMAPIEPLESVSVIQGFAVHPDARGLKIGSKLLDSWIDVAADSGRYNIIAETEQHNKYSWQLFLDHGVEIVSESVDPSDGALLYNHHKVLKL